MLKNNFLFIMLYIVATGLLDSFGLAYFANNIALILAVLSPLLLLFQNRRLKKDSFILLIYFIIIAILLPILSSIQTNRIFGQPILLGFLSERGTWFIFLTFLLIDKEWNLKKFNHFNNVFCISITIIAFILFFVFKFDNTYFTSLKERALAGFNIQHNNVENTLRGERLTLAPSFFVILSYSYYILTFLKKRKNIFLIPPILYLIDLLFVSKSRIQIIIFIALGFLIIFRTIKTNKFKLKIALGSLVLLTLLITINPAIIKYFDIFYNLTNSEYSKETGDFSGYMRLNEIIISLKYFLLSPILGIGNISYHFNGGYNNVLGEYFFLADIGGIFGTLMKNGLVGLIVIISLFLKLRQWIMTIKIYDDKELLSYWLIAYILLFPFMNFIFYNAICFSILIANILISKRYNQ